MPLKLISLNIEGHKHAEVVLPFLKKESPDVFCLQELYEADAARFASELSMEFYYVPMGLHNAQNEVHGVGIYSKTQIVRSVQHRYGGAPFATSLFDTTDYETRHASQCFSLALIETEKDGRKYSVGTTHFPVTRHGEATDFQREDMRALLQILEGQDEFVLCGDFNAPRGGEIFSMLVERYKDNVPAEYTSSIDGNLHRAGQLPYMVDGMFSTPGYSLSNVRMVSGVSDHCALVAEVTKN